MISRKTIMTIIIVIMSMALSGCAGVEPNEIAYVVALGIDKAENENYKITIQYANTTQISGGSSEEGGKSGNEIIENVTVEAPNIYAAMGLGNHVVSKTFSLSHAKLIVFSKEVAEKGIKDIMETFVRSVELRPDIFLAVAQEEASKYLDSVNPAMEVNPAQYYQLIYHKNNLIGIPQGMIKDFFFGESTGNYDSLLPISGVISLQKEEQSGGGSSGGESGGSSGGGSSSGESGGSSGGGSSGGESGGSSGGGSSGGESGGSSGGGSSGGESGGSSGGDSSGGEGEKQEQNQKQKEIPINESELEYKMKNYIGGQAAIDKKNKSETVGSAVFKGDKLIGVIGSIETEIYKLLIGDYDYSYLTVYSEKTPDSPVTVKATQDRKPRYKIDIEKKKIDIDLYIESDLYSLPSEYNIENSISEFEKNTQKYISKSCNEFIKNFLKTYDGCDILKLKEKSKSKFLTNKQYDEFKNSVNFAEFDINVNTHFKIRRTGLVAKE